MNLGDIRVGQVLYHHFTTRKFSAGSPITGSSIAVSVYKNDSTTESTSGITTTFTSGFDGLAGLVSVKIDTSSDGTFYAAGNDFSVVVTGGTADSVSVVGEVVAYFSIENRSALMPTTAARKLDVSAGGEAGVDWANVGSPTTSLALTGTTIASTQKVDIETIKTNPVVNGGTVTFASNTTVANTTGSVGSVTGAVGSVTGLTASDVGAIKTKTDFLPSATAGAAGGVFIAGTNAATTITTALTTTFTGNLTGSVGSVTGAVGSVTGAVGSVSGNVGGNVAGSVGSVSGNVGGNVSGSVASVAAGGIAASSFAAGAIDAAAIATDAIDADALKADAVTEIQTGLATSTALSTAQTDITAIKDVTDKLDFTLQSVGSPLNYQFTAVALELAPTGGSAPTAADVADAVWDEARAGHVGAGSFGEGVASVQGNVTGSVASVTGAVGSVTGAVGSVTGNVGGNVTGSVGSVSGNVGGNVSGSVASVAAAGISASSFAAGAIDAAAIATDAFGALELAAGAASEIATAVRTELTTELGRIDVATSTRLAPTTAGRTLDVTTTGEAGIDWANIGAPTTTVNLSGTTVKTATDVETDTSNIQTRLPAALVSGRIDASVGAVAAGAITAAAIATDAIDADALAANGLAEIADAVWDELLAGHAVSGSTGEALSAASAGGNPWAVVLEGSYTAQDLLRIIAGMAAGKTTITPTTSGASVIFRDVTDASDIISADMSGSERVAVTLAP